MLTTHATRSPGRRRTRRPASRSGSPVGDPHRRQATTFRGRLLAGCLTVLPIVLLPLLAAFPAAAEAPSPSADLVLVLDASGSMWGQIGGENKIVIARRVVGELVEQLPDGQTVGLVAYGHRREGDCADIETVVPPAPLDRGALRSTVDALNPKGKTPITASLESAFGLLRDGRPATVVLVSDGLETCGGDPCAAVRAAAERNPDFVLHVVGFDLAGEDLSQLECAAQAGRGLFLGAGDGDELAGALDAAVALTPEVPAGRLSLKATADGDLQDVAIRVRRLDAGATGEGAGEREITSRTYADPATNPRSIPLPEGRYEVTVQAVGLKGAADRRLGVEIAGGATVEREVDFSRGELVLGVTRNGGLSDALYRIRPAGSDDVAAQGRTYTDPRRNPARVILVSGDYDVEVSSVEIEGKPAVDLGRVTVEPRGEAELSHDFVSGTLVVGVQRAGALVDAVVTVRTGGDEVARARTYDRPASNPASFVLAPGEYTVEVAEIRGEKAERRVTVEAGAEVGTTVELQ